MQIKDFFTLNTNIELFCFITAFVWLLGDKVNHGTSLSSIFLLLV